MTIPGSRIETDATAHKIIKFITDVFFSEYAQCCEARRYKVDEIKDVDEDDKPTEHFINIPVHIATRKTVKTVEELEHKVGTNRYLNFADHLSSFTDGLRSTSPLDRYTNFYKVIECVFTPRNRSTKDDLKACGRLISLINTHKNQTLTASAGSIIERLVDLRHECSHLKPNAHSPIGYTSNEQEQLREIKGYLPLLEKICRELVQ